METYLEQATIIPVLMYLILDSITLMINFKVFDKGGILAFANIMPNTIFKFKLLSKVASACNYRNFIVFVYVRLLVSLLLIFNVIPYGCILLLLVMQVILYFRNEIYFNLADKFAFFILLGLSNYYCFDSLYIKEISIYFIAVMAIFSYFFTGYFKLKSKVWRKGEALRSIMSTHTYGNEYLYNLLKEHPFLSRCLNHSIFFFQISAVLSMLSPTIAVIFIGLGLLFHLSIAAFMNLNNFFWVFLSTYPCIYYTSVQLDIFGNILKLVGSV